MRIPLVQFAHQLDLHPVNALLYLKRLVESLDDVWPEVDESLLESVRGLDWGRFGTAPTPHPVHAAPAGAPAVPGDSAPSPPPVSREALRILDKLVRNRFWGGNKAAWEKIRRHYCASVADIDPLLDELQRLGWLIAADGGHAFSLDPARRGEIEKALRSS